MIAPRQLLAKIQSKELSKEEAVSLLVSLIENCESTLERAEFLDILGSIAPKNERFFKFFENYLISDRGPRINNAACKALIRNFQEKSISALDWAVKHLYSSRLIKTILDELEFTETEKLKEFRASVVNSIVGEGDYKINYEEARALLDLYILLEYDGQAHTIHENGHVIRLSLTGSKLTEVTEFIQVFKKLKYLDLRENKIAVIPNWVCEFKDLESLRLDGRILTSLPECILTHEKLESLGITGLPNTKQVPEVALKFARLKTAKKYIQRGVLPNEAFALSVLEILNMRSFEKYNYTEHPDFNSGRLETFCFTVDDDGHVIGLYMIGGEAVWFEYVPEQISELTYLQELDLSGNLIKVLPDSIGQLKNLKKLNLWSNQLQEIPNFIYKLPALKEVELGGNDDIPDKVLKEFYATILKDREVLNNSEPPKYVRSVIKLGNSYAMTFPQDWANQSEIEEKKEVSLYPLDDKTLVVKSSGKEEKKTIFRLNSNEWSLQLIRQAIISAFKLNVQEIYIKYYESNQEQIYELLTELRREIVGIDFKNLTESDEFFVYFLLDTSKTTFQDVLTDLINLFITIIRNIIEGKAKNNNTLLLAEMDRKYSLGRRILITGLSEYPISRGYRNLPSIQFLGDRVILLYIRDFINEALNLKTFPQNIINKYSELLEEIPSFLIELMKNYNNINLDTITKFHNGLLELGSKLNSIELGGTFEDLEIRKSIKYFLNSFQNFFDIGSLA